MPIFTQDYVALPGSVEAAAHHARAVAGAHLADRQAEAEQLVRDMFSIGLGATAPGGVLGLVTTADDGGIRFELIYPNDAIEPVIPPSAHRQVSAAADRYGEGRVRSGRMIYAELRAAEVAA